MSAIILEYWRRITFEFSGKGGSTSGVFDIRVDSTGTPIDDGGKCDWKNVSGDSVTLCGIAGQYNGITFETDAPGAGVLSNFASATENTTYTEDEPTGTWSYVNANVEFTITASASTGGSISPSGSVSVISGQDQTFTITPSTGYAVSSVLVDGVDAGKVTTYTFTNVQADHTISASFVELETYDIIIYTNLRGSDGENEWKEWYDSIISQRTKSGKPSMNIKSNSFNTETGVGTITFSDTDTLPDGIFEEQTFITGIVLPECITSIYEGAFAGCTSLRTITFPSSVTNFGTLVFTGCTSLGKIIMNTPTPPTVDGGDLGVEGVDVEVPAGSGSAYANALGWSDQNIIEPTPTATYGFNLDKMVDSDYLMQGIMKK